MFKKIVAVLLLSCSLLSGCSQDTVSQPIESVCSMEDTFQQYINLVPESVLTVIQDAGYTWELVTNPGEDYNIKHISGLTIPELKKILIKNDEKKFRQVVVHEIFHAYDHTLGFISESDEFISIYEDEKDCLVVTGFISVGQHKVNEKEYFAESCQMWVYDRATLEQSAPKTYQFICALLEG